MSNTSPPQLGPQKSNSSSSPSVLPVLAPGDALPCTVPSSPLPLPSPPLESNRAPGLRLADGDSSDPEEAALELGVDYNGGVDYTTSVRKTSGARKPPVPLTSAPGMLPGSAMMPAVSAPMSAGAASFLSPGPLPILPRRFNDDATDQHMSAGTHSPPLRPQRAQSTPQSPATAVGSSGDSLTAPQQMQLLAAAAAPSGKQNHHGAKGARFGHSPLLHAEAHDHDVGAERDAQDVPEHRPLFEKNEHGVFQFATHPPPPQEGGMTRNRSAVNLAASMSAPAGAGAGPRNPPTALVASSLAGLVRNKSEEGGFHPHGTEKLPYNRVVIDYAPHAPSQELRDIGVHVRECLELRAKFVWTPQRSEAQYDIFTNPPYIAPSLDKPRPPKHESLHYAFRDGVFVAWLGGGGGDIEESRESLRALDDSGVSQRFEAPSRAEFGAAMGVLMDFVSSGPVKTFAHNRLHILEARFHLHELLNHDLEQLVQKSVPHRDFYNVRKIDNHVHHSAAMNQKHLLRFIKAKLKKNSDEIVIVRDGKELTLADVFRSLNMTAYDLNVDTLDMHADKTFHRFDKFNLKYNPVGESRLREVFLKYNNHIKGRYLAEVTQQVFEDLESNKYQFAEYRLSIYGAKKDEWSALSDWVLDNKLFSSNVRWMIQTPRLYSIYKASGQIKNFAEMLHNIFNPLFQVTIDPDVNPKLHCFLESVVGFDMVDDESLRERPFNDSMPTPEEWDYEYDPPYALFAYYIYANLNSLNKLRAFRGFSTFAFRPHCGEAGDIEHLAAGFLLAKGINHGLMLQKSPALQYLYYLAQIGISMSPLSNNLLFLEYDKNPFPKFFKKGLNVTLSTDDPLMIHVTREPLVEEYSVAAQVWKLSAIDMSEIARNSVLQSGFEQKFKAHWIGNSYWKRSLQGNDIRQTNCPDIRIQFRAELLGDELRMLHHHTKLVFDDSLIDRIM